MNLQRFYRFVFAVFFAFLAAFAWAQTGTRYALVIGNADYQRITKLRNTVNDARDIGESLKKLGYQVDLKLNLGQMQMVDAIEAFSVKLKSNRANEGFFWYAGHAVQIRDENYLLPVDITVDNESRVRAGSYSLNNLINMLDGAKNKVNILILDSCRDNPIPESGRGAGGSRGLAVISEVPSDLFIMFSTAPGDKAEDGDENKRNSPFAEAFLKNMMSTEPVYQMAIDVTQETLRLTSQRQRPFQRGSIINEKYYSLNPKAVTPPPQPGPQPGPQPAPVTVTGAMEHYNKGVMFFNRNDYDTAILEFTDAINLDQNFAEAYAYRAWAKNRTSNPDQGIIDADKAIKINPQLALAYFCKGTAYYNKKDYDKAITELTQSIRINPDYKEAYNNRALAYYYKKNYDKAIADYDQAIKIDKNYALAYFNRGSAWEKKGDKKKADADYAKAKQLGYK